MIYRIPETLELKGGEGLEAFACKTKIYSGPGALAALGELGARRLLVVCDPYFMENGTARRVAQASGAGETAYFSQVSPDPTVDLAAQGTALVKEFDPDTLVALGGGSAMDCAKAMVHFSGKPIRLVAVPTTSGSGSEVTDFAILTHRGVKHPLIDPSLSPAAAILDGELVRSLPPKLVADGGFDVLSHALEAFVARGAGPVTDCLAKEAFSVTYALLPASYGGKPEARERIHESACLAGMAFSQAGLGLCHALSHALGGAFHVPHGRLNAILLPAVVELNAQVCAERYARLAQSAGLGASARTLGVRSLKNGLVRLRRELGMPATLQEAGVEPQRVWSRADALVAAALADPCCGQNPLAVEGFMVRQVLEAVTGRG